MSNDPSARIRQLVLQYGGEELARELDAMLARPEPITDVSDIMKYLFRRPGGGVMYREVAHSLAEYGDQRAREARTAATEEAAQWLATTHPLLADAMRRNFGGLAGTPPPEKTQCL